MPNHAIVVGIDRYSTDLASLTGAVADALEFSTWLVASGQVLPANLALGVLPGPHSPPVPTLLTGYRAFGASVDGLDGVLGDFLDNPPADCERLFFFFSGHGAASSNSAYLEEAICLEGFTERAWRKALEVSSLLGVLNAIPALERFVLIDGCRNAVFFDDIRFGSLSRQPRPASGQRRNYVLRATGPGRKAAEVAGRGIFARHLCAGLKGAGIAKRWNPALGNGAGGYSVRWRALSEYVAGEIGTLDAAKSYEQLVYDGGEHPANEDPVLATFPAGHFGQAIIKVRLSEPKPPPADAVICARRNDSSEPDICLPVVAEGTIEFPVAPSAWVLWAKADGWSSRPPQKPVSAYSEQVEEEIALEHGQPPAPAAVEVREWMGVETALRSDAKKGSLAIRVSGSKPSDLRPPVRIAVLKESGEVVRDLVQRDEVGLTPGIYRVRLDTPDGAWTEETVLISAGELETLDLRLPDTSTPALARTLAVANKPQPSNGFAMPSESLGPLSAPTLVTVAALAVGQAVQGYQWGLAGLGIGRRWWTGDGNEGVEMVVADDRLPTEAGAGFDVPRQNARLWRMRVVNTPISAKLEAQNPSAPLYSASLEAEAGGYWLQLKDADRERRGGFKLATHVFERHVTLVVRHQTPAGSVALFQFGIPRDPDRRAEILRGLANGEALQRARAAGRDPVVDPVVIELAEGRWFEPFSALVAAAALFDRGDDGKELFAAVVAGLEAHGIAGPDIEVLLAAQADRAGNEKNCRRHILRALKMAQVPLVDRLLERLDGEARRLGIDSPEQAWIAEKLRQTAGHPLWSLRREDDKKPSGPPDAI